MAKLTAGVIGTGFMGKAHVEAIRRSGLGKVVAIAGAEEEITRETAKELGIERPYSDHMELAKDPDIQVIHNCTPNHFRFPISRVALTAGKHVVSEKPIAMDSREARLLLSAAQRSGGVNAVMFNYRCYPIVEQVRKMVKSGDLGEVYAVHGGYLQDWLLYETDYNWRVESALGGATRAISDIGAHWFDRVQFILGVKITEVTADLRTVLPVRKKSVTTVGTFGRSTTPRHVDIHVATEDYGSILIRFENEVRGAVTLSQVSAGRKNRLFFQIDGSERSVAWDQDQPGVLWCGYRDRPNEFEPKQVKDSKRKSHSPTYHRAGFGNEWADAVTAVVRRVYRYIGSGKKPGRDATNFPTFAEGYEAAVLVDRILNSSRQKRWVKINIT